jgi:hypothetical protein
MMIVFLCGGLVSCASDGGEMALADSPDAGIAEPQTSDECIEDSECGEEHECEGNTCVPVSTASYVVVADNWEMFADSYKWSMVPLQLENGVVNTIEAGQKYVLDMPNIEQVAKMYNFEVQFVSYPKGTDLFAEGINPKLDPLFGWNEAELAAPHAKFYNLTKMAPGTDCLFDPNSCESTEALLIEKNEGDWSVQEIIEVEPSDRGLRLVFEYSAPIDSDRDVYAFRWCSEGCATP